jgi:stearoyl-CoA desaturase (delta-9 desaturase)
MPTATEQASLPAPAQELQQVNPIAEQVSGIVFWGIHAATLCAIFTGVTWRAVAIGIAIYWVRMFAITAGYHRYFSHRAYKTSRFFQFLLGLLGTTAVQKGPIWWAAIHRHHHRTSDEPEDVHSPRQSGFWHSHVGWIASQRYTSTNLAEVRDLAKYPELRWLGKYHFVAPLALAVLCWLVAGWPGLVVGFGWSTVLLWHGTFTINSLAHVFGRRRYATTDDSRNNWLLALLTMGEGWHNNHHHYAASANQGFFWWEIDASFYVLRALAAVGLVRDLRRPPRHILDRTDPAPATVAEPAPPQPSLPEAA